MNEYTYDMVVRVTLDGPIVLGGAYFQAAVESALRGTCSDGACVTDAEVTELESA